MLIGYAFAGVLGEQTVAARDHLQDIAGTLAVMALIAIAFSYAATAFAKQWRKDHNRRAWSLSSSNTRATGFAFLAFLGEWHVAHSFNVINVNDWLTAGVLAAIIGVATPLSWNPLSRLLGYGWAWLRNKTGGEQGHGSPYYLGFLILLILIAMLLLAPIVVAASVAHWYCAAGTAVIEAWCITGLSFATMPDAQGNRAKHKIRTTFCWPLVIYGKLEP